MGEKWGLGRGNSCDHLSDLAYANSGSINPTQDFICIARKKFIIFPYLPSSFSLYTLTLLLLSTLSLSILKL